MPPLALSFRSNNGRPFKHYKFAKTVTYVTADGHVIEASKIRKNSKVRVLSIRQNDDMLVDHVIVDQD